MRVCDRERTRSEKTYKITERFVLALVHHFWMCQRRDRKEINTLTQVEVKMYGFENFAEFQSVM